MPHQRQRVPRAAPRSGQPRPTSLSGPHYCWPVVLGLLSTYRRAASIRRGAARQARRRSWRAAGRSLAVHAPSATGGTSRRAARRTAAPRAPVWKTAAQRLRPIPPPARPASARSIKLRAAFSLGQPRPIGRWQIRPGEYGRVSHTGAATQQVRAQLRVAERQTPRLTRPSRR